MTSRYTGKRRLLNLMGHFSTGAIVAEIEDSDSWGTNDKEGRPINKETGSYSIEPNVILQISNCDRSLQFEIDWDSKAGRINARYKIETMIECLKEFQNGLEREQERFVERQRHIDKLKKKKKEKK